MQSNMSNLHYMDTPYPYPHSCSSPELFHRDPWGRFFQHPQHHLHRQSYYWFNSPRKSQSKITYDPDKFEVKLDVHQFLPEELSVKMTDKYVVVEADHGEKEDAHGLISRKFVRRYLLPENAKGEEMIVNLSSDGILQIGVPRKEEAHHNDDPGTKQLTINQTGQPDFVSVMSVNLP